jgi:AcrR family transcriptional regulator
VTVSTTERRAAPLRERQRNALRTEIQRVALRLFAEHGFDAVTTEAIADEVGVSSSTFFRHVPSKEHLLLGVAQGEGAKIVANFLARPADEDARSSLRAAILGRTSHFARDSETLELWRRAMVSAPASVRRATLVSREDSEHLVAAVAERLGARGAGSSLRAGALVRATLAAADYAYEWWLTHEPRQSLHRLTEQALDEVAP